MLANIAFTDALLKQLESGGFSFLSGFVFAFFVIFNWLDIPDKINEMLTNQEKILMLINRGNGHGHGVN